MPGRLCRVAARGVVDSSPQGATAVKHAIKRWLFQLLDLEPEAIVVSFWSGDPARCRRMLAEVRSLLPQRRHFLVTTDPGVEAEGSTVIRIAAGPEPLAVRFQSVVSSSTVPPLVVSGDSARPL